ncbi:hypothetical protein ZIOFF_001479 [Zingiber officinale]|uniref:Uncharacterized protein n=1 Tax=Zingiber officinale TaxID=94328 RepID=A0A8J5IML9_ZINOF|nr:hypothetical protein ZIOFF_001479 [Zingiber officinale]
MTVDGFIKGYTHWVAHGEIAYSASTNFDFVQSRKDADDMQGLVYEAFEIPEHNDSIISTSAFENDKEIPTREAEKFYKLIDDSQKELYPVGMAPKRRTKRKSRFKLQTEIDMQPSAMCTNHTDQHSIEQGTLNNHRDAASNQFHVDVQDHIPHVENNSVVPDQNDDMNEKSNEDSDDVLRNTNRKKRVGMTPKRRTKRKSRFKLQTEINMQPSAMCINHTDRHSIEQGTLNNHRDAASNQFHVDVHDHIPHVENNSVVPDQNDDMNEKSNEGKI